MRHSFQTSLNNVYTNYFNYILLFGLITPNLHLLNCVSSIFEFLKIKAQNWKGELAVACLTGLLTFPIAVVTQFTPLYHIPHDVFGIHSEICFWLLIFGYCTCVFWGIMRASPTNAIEIGKIEEKKGTKKRGK